MDGTQLAAASVDGVILVWRYPSYERIFKKKRNTWHGFQIAWNPFNCDVLAVYEMVGLGQRVQTIELKGIFIIHTCF